MESTNRNSLCVEYDEKYDPAALGSVDGFCFHCGLPIDVECEISVVIGGKKRDMCCHGCEAVASAIVAYGQENFYQVRTDLSATGRQLVPDLLRESEVYDLPDIQQRFVHCGEADRREASLILEGISCAACLWLIEKTLARLPGMISVTVNYASHRAFLCWQESQIKLSEILQAVQRLGYRAQPFDPHAQQLVHRRERRRQHRRVAVAGLFGMQVMMLSISLYGGAWSGMEYSHEQFFRWLSLALTLPVIIYSATPFFSAAWRDLKQWRVTMDFPVSLAIIVAFSASATATLIGHGEIYFDSVVMFVFFLSVSRHFEFIARQRCVDAVEKLVQALPLMATRLDANGNPESPVAATTLAIGDRVLVRAGETVPADGELLSGHSAIDESLLNGESIPLDKSPGASLLGGSINVTNPLQMTVTAVGSETAMAEIQRSIERAQLDKPALLQLADWVAARFIVGLLLIVIAVATYWWHQNPERWFEISLAVLIVSCPCALSLAIPTAVSATLGKMQTQGLLVKRSAVLENLTRITHVVFDKTGTLTLAEPVLQETVCNDGLVPLQTLALAASIAQFSDHPLSKALLRGAGDIELNRAEPISATAGGGISAKIDGRDYFIGSADFIHANSSDAIAQVWLEQIDRQAVSAVWFAQADRVLAMFTFVDQIRGDAKALVSKLQGLGKTVILMTGDRFANASKVAAQLGIDSFNAQLSPQAKMAAVQSLQGQSAHVLMIGDGINDAPVLASADVSIAVAGASSLAQANADIVLMTNRLEAVAQAIEFAKFNQRIVRQSMLWALVYNIAAIPAAAMGLVAPWLAALGMSLSSLVVVSNALRLSR